MGFASRLIEKSRHNLRFEISFLKTLLVTPYSTAERKAVEAFRDRHAGEVGMIIANGPSLNEIDFEKVKNFVTIGMNRIYLLYDKYDFRPDYYCLEDHLVAEDNAQEINALQGSVMFVPKDLSYCIRNPNVLYVNLIRRYWGMRRNSRFSTDFSQCVYWGGTVTYYALQLAYYLGFSKVYIVGLDHNYNKPSHVTGQQTFISQGDDVNHFDPRYFGRGKRWHAPNVGRMELSYVKAKEAFEQASRKIINATPHSKLDVFAKIDFEDIPELKSS